MDFKKLLVKRRSVRRFMLGKKVDWRKILRALDSVRLIPAAGNKYNLKFVLVSDEEMIKKISEACQQSFVASASYVVVCVNDEGPLISLYGERGKRYASQQAGAAIENFLLSLTQEGLATTWIGHFYEEMIKHELRIPDDLIVEAIFPIGIEAKDNTSKTTQKVDLDTVVYFEKWKDYQDSDGHKYMKPKYKVSSESR